MAAAVRLAWFLLLFSRTFAEHIMCPTSCSCLGSLVDCSERGLIDIPKDMPIWVEYLELQHNDITSIPENAFEGLLDLKKIDLSHNQLRYLNSTSFRHLQVLDELKVQHNHLTEIPSLGSLPNLTVLSLSHNKIFNLNAASVEQYASLQTLDLANNLLIDVPAGSFPNTTKLQQLLLNNNRIASLEKGSLDNLTSLEWLKLNKNHISGIPKDLFRKLSALKHLELSRNRISHIEGLVFQGLESLQVLKLRRNRIVRLLDGAFWGLTSIKQLHLDNNNITRVTKGWLYGLASLHQLTLSHNQVFEIEDDGWEFCRKLTELDLTYNRLQSIIKGTFSKLHNLKYLYLDHNQLSYVEEGAFKPLSSLLVMELNHNEISWTIEDTNGAFVGLDRLTHLGLTQNHIKSIAKMAFFGLPRLRNLDLTQNPVTAIQENAFAKLRNLQELKLNSSSLLCDCSLQWLPTWIQNSAAAYGVTATCGHPAWLRGASIVEANPNNFTCDDFPKPYITEEPQTQIALKGENATLVCKAVSTTGSNPKFQWRKDERLLLDGDMESYEDAHEGGLTEYVGLLHLREIQDKDEGRYQCVVSTESFGSLYSQKARVTVHVFPVFTKTPVNITVKAGLTAKLQCAARGQPPPEIAWQKDGGDDFPAARERRMHVMPSDDVFFIVNVKASDMGVYSCTANNAAGVIVANATLTILETPSFVRVMKKKKQTKEGETAVLECMAAGSPKPQLNWTKDGLPLVTTERHFFTADNQLLIVVQTHPSDSGRYTCEMSNALGSQRDYSDLNVLPDPSGASTDDTSTTTGIIVIAVVCCVVGTSLIWVIIIYQTRKRHEEYAPTGMDDHCAPGEHTSPFAPTPILGQQQIRGSTTRLFSDTNSEGSSRDSGTGDSRQHGSNELLPYEESRLLLPGENTSLSPLIQGSSSGGSLPPDSPCIYNGHGRRTLRTFQPTSHGSPRTEVIVHAGPPLPAAEVTRWRCSSDGHLSHDSLRSAASSTGDKDSGFATFPRAHSQVSWSSSQSVQIPRDSDSQHGSETCSVASVEVATPGYVSQMDSAGKTSLVVPNKELCKRSSPPVAMV